MTDDANEDPENDPLLRSMRSVWLGMRDEEPPQRGLAELMAAARAQADVMKPKESWWRKSLALLVRPPVLAAATVLVVVGGAVALNRRGAEAPAPMVESELTAKAAPKQEPVEPPRDVAKKELAAEEAPAAGSAAADGRSSRVTAPTAANQQQPQPPVVTKPNIVDAPATVKISPPPPPPPPSAEPGGGEGGMVIANDAPVVEGTKSDKKPTRGTRSEPTRFDEAEGDFGARAPTTADPAPAPRRAPTVSTDQLVKQAQAAASRNDCAAVKVTADRVKKTDPAAYKTRLATQPAIARCLK